MNKLLETIKTKNSKRITENAVIILVLLIIVIIVINILYSSDEKEAVVPTVVVQESIKADAFEQKLEKILSNIEGAGRVNVMVSYMTSEEKVPLYDTTQNTTVTEEKDKEGGTRKTESKSTDQKIIFEENGNSKQPYVRKITTPQIIGMIVVAEGATSAKVRENLINAVMAVAEVPAHRVQVFAKQK